MLYLLVKTDYKEMKISKLLLSHSRAGVGTVMLFNGKLRVNVVVVWTRGCYDSDFG